MLQLNDQGQVVNVITETEVIDREAIVNRMAEIDTKIADFQAMRAEVENDLNEFDALMNPQPQAEVAPEVETPAEEATDQNPEVPAQAPTPEVPVAAETPAPTEQPVDAVQPVDPQPTDIPVTELGQ